MTLVAASNWLHRATRSGAVQELIPQAILILFGASLVICCLIALKNWRVGLLICLAVAVVQDPIRKVIPGTPIWLTLSFTPVYFSALLGLRARTTFTAGAAGTYLTELKPSLVLLGLVAAGSILQTLSYGPAAIPLAMLGVFSTLGIFPAALMGYHFPQKGLSDLERVLKLLAGVTAVMLIGVPLELVGVELPLPLLGTVGLEKAWFRWYGDDQYIPMISGFYRSPEVMGWHAGLLAMISIYFLLKDQAKRLPWGLLMLWGTYGTVMSGRRKMFVMLMIYLITMLALTSGRYRQRAAMLLAAGLLIVLPFGLGVFQSSYLEAASTGFSTATARAVQHGSVMELLKTVGPLGYGLGTKAQGSQHLSQVIRTPLIEGGVQKLLVEVGYVGCLTLVLFGLTVLRMMFRSAVELKRKGLAGLPARMIGAVLITNGAAFFISFSIFGDPMVVLVLGFLVGTVLSAARLPRPEPVEPADAEEPKAENNYWTEHWAAFGPPNRMRQDPALTGGTGQ